MQISDNKHQWSELPPTCGIFPWVALKVDTRSEPRAVKILDQRRIETYSPTVPERRKSNQRSKSVEVPVFPGYILARWDDANRKDILSCPAVQYVVRFGGKPAVIAEETVEGIRRMLSCGARPVPYLRSGQLIRIESGLLAGIEGRYKRQGSAGMLVVSVDMFERSVAVHIEDTNVRLIESRPQDCGREQVPTLMNSLS